MFSTRCYLCIHAGPVKTTFAGIYIGKGTGMKNFKGYIDEVSISNTI